MSRLSRTLLQAHSNWEKWSHRFTTSATGTHCWLQLFHGASNRAAPVRRRSGWGEGEAGSRIYCSLSLLAYGFSTGGGSGVQQQQQHKNRHKVCASSTPACWGKETAKINRGKDTKPRRASLRERRRLVLPHSPSRGRLSLTLSQKP